MLRTWEELTDKEQKEAVSLLHIAKRHFLRLVHGPEDQELIEIAINYIDFNRRKFKK